MAAPRFVRYVNPLQGTDSHHGFSTGNTLPLVAMPFGMNHWSPQTAEGSWFFSPHARKLQGMRLTHQPSPWMGDYGALVIMPQSGTLTSRRHLSSDRRAQAYRPDQTTFAPHYFQAELIGTGILMEFAPTLRGGIFRFRFPEGRPARFILEPAKGLSKIEMRPDRMSIAGYTRGNAGGVPEGFAHYFVVRFDEPFEGGMHFHGNEPYEDVEKEGTRVGISLDLGEDLRGPVIARIATSFISIEQAERNLDLEVAGASFEEIVGKAEAAWEANLGRIEVESDDEDQLRTFYSCLYRTQLFPRIWHEVDAEGKTVHYSPYDGKVHEGILYTDNGFWDTYRTEYPLLALLDPERVGDILQGWVNAYKEGGWFPQWATPGYRACMVGTHIDAVMADAVARGVRNFDMETALDGMLKHAYEIGDADGAYGRIGIEDYKELGYVATDRHHEAVARSLDYAYDDFCIAQVAKALGREEVAGKLLKRATNYVKQYDPEVGFMRGRNADGSWLAPFDPFKWGSPYVEGGAWQSSFAVQHDAAGLIALMGGDEAFVAKLDELLATPPRFEVGVYGFEIHEMTEMACASFGQYAHSNQPVHHILYMYASAGRPDRTQAEVRRVMNELYTPTHLPGDEDNGEMCAWYVLSALGIFPLTPGHPSWVLGAPLFKKAAVHLPNGKDLVVEAPANQDGALFVTSVSFDGEPVENLWLTHGAVANGGALTFDMSATKKEGTTPDRHRPFSLSVIAN